MPKFRLFCLLLILCGFMTVSAQTSRHDKSLGVEGGYISHNRSASAGLAFDYAFSSHFVLAPSIDIVFPHYSKSAALFNLDCHVPFRFSSPSNVEFFPLVGIGFNSWRYKGDTVNDSVTHLGVNLGAGLQWRVKPSLKLFLKARYTFATEVRTTALQVGIAHVF